MAYKALKAARGAHGSRDASRMMQKMGVKMDELQDVSQVIIRTPSKDIVIETPTVTLVTVQGQAMYQVVGGEITEVQPQPGVSQPASGSPPDADVQLVVQQTGKTPEEAKRALIESGGDLARAILVLKGQSSSH